MDPVFATKGITFYGDSQDIKEYRSGFGRAIFLKNNLNRLIDRFADFSSNAPEEKHFLLHSVNNIYNILLYYNPENKHDTYLMIYDKEKDVYSFGIPIDAVEKLCTAEKVIKSVGTLCKFSDNLYKNDRKKELTILYKMQDFADKIDNLRIEYE